MSAGNVRDVADVRNKKEYRAKYKEKGRRKKEKSRYSKLLGNLELDFN
ncbi:MAG: hypothetical protein ACRC62_05235 [Microcoleus sp.]